MSAGRSARLVFVTGLSGSGKSMASRVLEDLGYYVLDNLPTSLIGKFVELMGQSEEEIPRAALVVDLRDRSFTRDFPRVLDEVRAQGHEARVLFLEASDDALLRRFSETRRTHPLGDEGTMSQAIAAERAALGDIRKLSDRILDTTALNIHTLTESVVEWMRSGEEAAPTITLTLLTFGFKYGTPRDADWVFDVRFLPNPFFVAALREQSGQDPEVSRYVMQDEIARRFVGRVCDMLREVIPRYAREGRSHLTVAIGCTGGRHRSVTIGSEIAAHMASADTRVVNIDRDIDKG